MPFQLYDAPFYGQTISGTDFFSGSGAVSSLVPDTFHVSLNGHTYMVDLNQPFYRQYRRQIAPLLRTQADSALTPGDNSMDPNSLWRRSYEDWSLGAGQQYQDRSSNNASNGPVASVPNSYFASKGIDSLTTKWQIGLLHDTTNIYSTAATNLGAVVAENYIYVLDGQHAYYASSLAGPFTAVANTPAVTISSMCTDGFNVWFACGADGVYHTTAGSVANADQWVTSAIDSAAVLGYCNGRLMLASTNKIYNIVAGTGTALPAALFTAGNSVNTPSFTGFAEGTGAIYAGALIGNRSYIYGMTVTSDGTALGAPVIQGALPDGETITAVYGYLTFLIVGTSSGVRMCTTDNTTGAVTLGALIPTPNSVQCMVGWERWVWFGWTAYDSVSSGLGRLDLQNQVIDNVLPAFASDLMVTTQAATLACTAYNGQIVFGISGLGYYGPSTNLVPSGTIDSGYVLYDLTDSKVACILDVQDLGPTRFGSFTGYVSTNTGPFSAVGTVTTHQTSFYNSLSVGPVTGQRFQVRFVLNRDSVTTTAGPLITRWTLRSYPAPNRPITWQIPILLNENIASKSGTSVGFSPLLELQTLEFWATAGTIVTYQEGYFSYPVFIQDIEFLPDYTEENRTPPTDNYFNGVALITLVGLPPTNVP